jgi:hypothetical protein
MEVKLSIIINYIKDHLDILKSTVKRYFQKTLFFN